MKGKHILLVLFLAAAAPAVFTGCSNSEAAAPRQEVVLDDGKPKDAEDQNEVVIDDSALRAGGPGLSTASKSSTEEEVAGDGSKITVMTDGYGNKSETRCFANDSRVKCVVVETNAAKKSVIVTVYGQIGVTKTLPGEKLKDALTASADKIASAAQLVELPQQADVTKMLPKNGGSEDLKPLPSSAFPVLPANIPDTEAGQIGEGNYGNDDSKPELEEEEE
jgi:hypothetical protein